MGAEVVLRCLVWAYLCVECVCVGGLGVSGCG